MKKIIGILAVLTVACGISFSSEMVICHLGKLDINIPGEKLQAITLFDFWQGQGLIGGETQIMQYNNACLNGGVVTAGIGSGTPFLSIDYNFSHMSFLGVEPKVGLWYGRDFDQHINRAGIKAGIEFYSLSVGK